MSNEEQKILAFGHMVFGLMTDVLVLPPGGAYVRKTVTMPDGRGGKHRIDLIVARPEVADAIEEVIATRFKVTNIKAESGDPA